MRTASSAGLICACLLLAGCLSGPPVLEPGGPRLSGDGWGERSARDVRDLRWLAAAARPSAGLQEIYLTTNIGVMAFCRYVPDRMDPDFWRQKVLTVWRMDPDSLARVKEGRFRGLDASNSRVRGHWLAHLDSFGTDRVQVRSPGLIPICGEGAAGVLSVDAAISNSVMKLLVGRFLPGTVMRQGGVWPVQGTTSLAGVDTNGYVRVGMLERVYELRSAGSNCAEVVTGYPGSCHGRTWRFAFGTNEWRLVSVGQWIR